ncbi:MAG: sensor histidine kinase [Christensenellales bacterium]
MIWLCAVLAAALTGVSLLMIFRQKKLEKQVNALCSALAIFSREGDTLDYSVAEDILAPLQNGLAELTDEIHRSREQLQQHRERTVSLIADISHQLKTPLASMELYLEMMAQDTGDPRVDKLFILTHRMEKLIVSLLQLEKLNARAYSLKYEEGDVSALLRKITGELMPLFPEKEFVLPSFPVPGRFDHRWLEEALANILKNACEHTSPSGKILIQASAEEGMLRIRIEDDGGGIPAEALNRIFDRFSSLTPGVGSTGLGLAIARSILNLHHGDISAFNGKRGLVLSLWLPQYAGTLVHLTES